MKRTLLNSLLVAGLFSAPVACAASAPSSCSDPYQLVSGEVTKSGVVSPPDAHCFHSECPKPRPESRFQAVLIKPLLNGQHTDKIILAFTPEEDDTQLREKPGYMEIGKTYEFCAKPMDHQYTEGHLAYEIDDLDTIKEMN